MLENCSILLNILLYQNTCLRLVCLGYLNDITSHSVPLWHRPSSLSIVCQILIKFRSTFTRQKIISHATTLLTMLGNNN